MKWLNALKTLSGKLSMFTDATNRTQFFIFYLSLWSHFFAQIGQIRYFLYFVYVKCFICPYGANFLHKLAKYIMLNQNTHNKSELGPKSSNLWNWIETGDRVGSLWISISRDSFENAQSLGHTNSYPQSPFRLNVSDCNELVICKKDICLS